MKKIAGYILLVLLTVSCSSVGKLSSQKEDLVVTRKYIGNFIEFRQTPPPRFGDPNLIWIKTTMEDTYGRISAYSKECGFKPGDRLYIRKIYMMPGGISGYWEYKIESDDQTVSYRMTEFQNDRKVSVTTWF
jgi:hypothetical protein